jgi:hypothetical protein
VTLGGDTPKPGPRNSNVSTPPTTVTINATISASTQ